MHRRRFSPNDQLRFAALSGDSNPMHMDPLAARRTQAGVPVVHGMHALLWALDCAASDGLNLGELQHLKVQFAKFIPVREEATLDISQSGTASARLTVQACGLAAIVALLRFGPRSPEMSVDRTQAPVGHTAHATEMSLAEMGGCHGWLGAPVPADRFAEAFPHAASCLEPRRLSGLAQTSRLVGMVCPGLHSIYAGLTLELTGMTSGQDGLGFHVTKADERFRMVDLAIRGDGLAGRVSAFVRHPPIAPPAMADLARSVRPGEFAGTRAIVVGGSRGLGALTAMLLASGGASVIITYARGRHDAEQVCGLINAACGAQTCSMLAYEAMAPAKPQLAEVKGPITQLYYFATPHIFPQKPEHFSSDAFHTFTRIYVDAFHECCHALDPRPAAIFYPSSVAVEQRPAGMLEYAMAKAAGEMLCGGMQDAGWRILKSRLPRLLTDQTATVARAETADSVAVMLELIRQM